MEVESQLKANKVEVENRQHTVQDLKMRIASNQARLDMTPVREQQMAGLTRDYEQSRKNYEQLLAKRDQSEMATDLEKELEGERFRVPDPPNTPQKPLSPNRLKLNLIGLVAGLMVGVAMLVGAEMVDDRIYSKEEFATIVSAPVLAEIPPLTTALEQDQLLHSEWLQRGALSVMVVLVAAALASSYLFG
jgi:uncharacterized protein involved in exopolysaccharide biosynthesis